MARVALLHDAQWLGRPAPAPPPPLQVARSLWPLSFFRGPNCVHRSRRCFGPIPLLLLLPLGVHPFKPLLKGIDLSLDLLQWPLFPIPRLLLATANTARWRPNMGAGELNQGLVFALQRGVFR